MKKEVLPLDETFDFWRQNIYDLPKKESPTTLNNVDWDFEIYDYNGLSIMLCHHGGTGAPPVLFVFGYIKNDSFVYHRENGPALYTATSKNFYINNKKMDQSEFFELKKKELIRKVNRI